MPGESFRDEQLEAVLGLLEGPGVVWKLAFGSWILLQPERVNAYAQAVIQTLRSDRRDLGTIAEDKVLRGELAYQSSLPRLSADDERIVLLAMHQILVERGCAFASTPSMVRSSCSPASTGANAPTSSGIRPYS
jgi:hypothetical protein